MTLSYFITLFVCSIVFGSVMGAYFSTAEYRVRLDEPLMTAHCYCPVCRHTLSIFYQFPVVSWIALRGRCHYCNSPISIRYPLTEAGFLLYYGVTFILCWRHPFMLSCLWLGFIVILLLLRCKKHFHSCMKAAMIFTGYHVFYLTVLLIIYAAL